GLIGDAFEDDEDEIRVPAAASARTRQVAADDDDDDDDDGGFSGLLALGAVAHHWYIAQARLRRLFGIKPQLRGSVEQPYDFNDDEFGTLNEPVRPKAGAAGDHRVEPSLEGPVASEGFSRRSMAAPSMLLDDDDNFDDAGQIVPDGILSDDDVPFAPSSR